MNRRCTVCNHAERPEIDRELIRGVPYRALASRFGLIRMRNDFRRQS